jgi:hypothetical protein
MMKKLSIGVVILLFAFPPRLAATTVVVIVTKNGMVISSDSKTGLSGGDNQITGSIAQDKFAILQQRIVVAAVGTSGFSDAHFEFDFLKWMEKIRSKLPYDASVDDVSVLIEKESSVAFSGFGFDTYLKSGVLTDEYRTEPCTMLTQFVIFGYQHGKPRIYTVQFDIDWNKKALIGPTRSLNAYTGTGDFQIVRFGAQEALMDITVPNSYAHRVAMELCPDVITKIDARRQLPSLDDTLVLSRAMVQVEENTNPSLVGGPIKSVKILPDGHAEEVSGRTSKERPANLPLN